LLQKGNTLLEGGICHFVFTKGREQRKRERCKARKSKCERGGGGSIGLIRRGEKNEVF